MQNPEGYTQMDGPEEAMRESSWPETNLWPRKRGHGRVSAAIRMRLGTCFRGVVPGLYFFQLL